MSALIENLQSAFAPPHPAGYPFIAGGAVLALVGLFVAWPVLVLGLAFAVFCLFFFRDPERVPSPRAAAVVAPADGRVVMVSQVVPPVALGLGDAPVWRVATFLSVLNVHVNRVPVAGTVTAVAYSHGKFLNASLDKASDDNERNGIAIRMADGRGVGVVQIAGLVARRIVCSVRQGEAVRKGARFGIIRFGSRTDLYLPPGVEPLVVVGQTMVGGETVMADLHP